MDSPRPYRRAMVIGGIRKFVRGTLTNKLSFYGLVPVMDWHVDMEETSEKFHRGIHPKCEVLVLFKDMVAYPERLRELRAMAEERGIPVLQLTRHASQWPAEMKQQGFEPINPNTAEALREPEEQDMAQEKKEKDIPVQVVETPRKALDPFSDRMDALVKAVRDLRDHDGVHTIMWAASGGMTVERTQKIDREV